MRTFFILSLLSTLVLSASKCGSKKTPEGIYKGKLEIKALCMNYTISVNSPIAADLVTDNWTDETTGKSYRNVFSLASRCTFPSTIEAGDEFYFVLDTTAIQDCAVCLAFYPTPDKKLSIRVVEKP